MNLVWAKRIRKTGWQLGYLEVAAAEAQKVLNDEQYDYVVRQFEDMASFDNPLKCPTVDVEKVGDFYELRDKGGILGKINIRAYFTVETNKRIIVVLSVYKKEDEGMIPPHMVSRVMNRMRWVRQSLK